MISGLSYPVYKGVMKKGYTVPTPIQRKVSQCHLENPIIKHLGLTAQHFMQNSSLYHFRLSQ